MQQETKGDNIDDLRKQLQDQVNLHEDLLIKQLKNGPLFENVFTTVDTKMNGVNGTIDRLDNRLHAPFLVLQDLQLKMERYQKGAQTLRHVVRFLALQQRLQEQMKSIEPPFVGTDVTQATVTLKEIEAFVSMNDLFRIDLISDERENLRLYRKRLVDASRVLFEHANTNMFEEKSVKYNKK